MKTTTNGTTKAAAKVVTPTHNAAHDGHPIKVSDGAVIFHKFSLGRDIGVVSVSEYGGKVALDIRRFYLSIDDEWCPTAKGIRIPADSVREVIQALNVDRDSIGQALGGV